MFNGIYVRSTPHPVTVTTRIITFLVGNPYKPSFATVTGWGVDPIFTVFTRKNGGDIDGDLLVCRSVTPPI